MNNSTFVPDLTQSETLAQHYPDLESISNKLQDQDPEGALLEKIEVLRSSIVWENMHPQIQEAYLAVLRAGVQERRFDETHDLLFLEDPDPFFANHSPESAAMITSFAERHIAIYQDLAREITTKIVRHWDHDKTYPGFSYNAKIYGSMYSGKNTLMALIAEQLREKDYHARFLIAGVLGESRVRARALIEAMGDHPFADLPAIPIGPSNWEAVADNIIQEKQMYKSNIVVFIDEAAFVDEITLIRLIQRLNDSTIRVLISGLDKTGKGIPLKTFASSNLNQLLGLQIQLKSFRPQSKDETKPSGTETLRYLKIGQNGSRPIFMRDFGALPTVVSRSLEHVVVYTPGLSKESIQCIFSDRPDLLHVINHDEFSISADPEEILLIGELNEHRARLFEIMQAQTVN